MSRDPGRRPPMAYRDRDPRVRGRDRDFDRPYHIRGWDKDISRKRSRSPRMDKRRSRSPRKPDKNDLDEKILSEISKLPEPSELWDSQFQDNFAPPAPTFLEGSSNTYGANYQQHSQYTGIYDDFPSMSSVPPTPHPPEISGAWNTMSLPTAPAPPSFNNSAEDQKEERMKKEAAIESEMRHQKAALSKQREDYMKKAGILKKELETLKDQRNELRGDSKRSPSPDTKRFLKENTKLQLEIQNKLKTINNVVDMLNGIIGEEAQELPVTDDASERSNSKRKSRSPNTSSKYNYVYYDPEMHWCRVCNEFPSTAKDYLNHLHSPAHHKMAAAHLEAPWHSMTGVNEGFPSYPSAPTKRTPIRGLQFFVPSTAWYCKLCDQFIGDLHCASAHLKSITHSKNYTNFVEQNPHWETDWMSDRQKAFEKSRGKSIKQENKPSYTAHTITFNKDGFHSKRNKDSPPPEEEKKKKKDKKRKKKKDSSSSSSDSSDSSDSEKASKKKKSKKDKIKSQAHDKALNQWMSAIAVDKLNENDRQLIDNIKQRIKLEKRDDRRNRSPDRQERAREREKERERVEQRKERRGSRSRDERREEQRGTASPKKPDVKKMPFIGKMPVFKNLKKAEEIKKEDQKKDEETEKKKKEEMDAEIQRKVAEFKEKISRAQQERALSALGAPGMALPTQLGSAVPFLPPPQMTVPPPPIPPPASSQAPNLQKDFQEALDIIYPSEAQKAIDKVNQELFKTIPGFVPSLIPGFPNLSMMPPQIPPPMMMGFDINSQIFQSQLYDNHVQNTHQPVQNTHQPVQNQQNQRQNTQQQNKKNNQQNQFKNQQKNHNNQQKNHSNNQKQQKKKAKEAKHKEEMDDLAMLGIDASDVGAMN